jgi:hypothetical protein
MSNPNVTINRDKFIGGSDLPTILGLNAKYGTSIFDFAREKIGLIPKTFKGNQFTRYGQLMEPAIRDYINSIFGANYLEDTIVDTDRGYRGNTDGIDREAEYPILEVKTFGEELDVDYYEPQCQFYMETFNVDACILVGYKRPKDFYTGIDYDLENDDSYFNVDFDPTNIVIHKIKRDRFIWARIEERIVAFKKALDYLREKRDDATEDEFNNIFYGTDLVAMTNKIAVLERQLNSFKDIEKEHKKLKEELYKVFEDKGILSFDTGAMKITRVNPTSYSTETIDTAKLKEDNEEIYNKYKVIKTTNKKGYILITNKKEDK